MAAPTYDDLVARGEALRAAVARREAEVARLQADNARHHAERDADAPFPGGVAVSEATAPE